MLRPGIPEEGVPKAPNTPNNPRVGVRMQSAGAAVGIDFTGKCDRVPNTLLAHCLLDYVLEAHGAAKQNEVQEGIFKSYFTDGLYPDSSNLVTVGEKSGLEKIEVEAALRDADRMERVRWEIEQNSRQVRGGVPFFVFNGRPAFSGAQDPSTFHEIFDILLAEKSSS